MATDATSRHLPPDEKLSRNGAEIAFDFSSEAMNQLILRAAGEGIYGVNADGKTTFVNPAAERMLGWTAEELVGHDMHSIVHHTHPDGSHYPEHACPIYAAFRDGAVHQVDTEVFWRKDGTSFWVEYTSTPIRDRGHVVGAVIVFRDVTQRREADEKLRAAREEVDRLRERLELENAYLQEEIRIEGNHHGIVGRSAAIQKVSASGRAGGADRRHRADHRRVRHRQGADRARHPRRQQAQPAAADPRQLRDHPARTVRERVLRARQGRVRRRARDGVGRFELADGGTLFLDEVADMPLELQGKLLRVLEESNFERVGEEQTRTVDVRVIAATNRDLKQEVRRGRFREDLYFRLDVFPIESVPLRERRDDIPLLAAHFVQGEGRKLKRELKLTEGDVRRLMQYDWPGNVRELENVIERAAILARHARLRIDLPAARSAATSAPAQADRLLTDDERRERDRANILAALESCGGKVFGRGGAAELLDVKPTTLASRIKALGITVEKARDKNGRGASAT